jgi:hypothetical protein
MAFHVLHEVKQVLLRVLALVGFDVPAAALLHAQSQPPWQTQEFPVLPRIHNVQPEASLRLQDTVDFRANGAHGLDKLLRAAAAPVLVLVQARNGRDRHVNGFCFNVGQGRERLVAHQIEFVFHTEAKWWHSINRI